MKYSFNDFAKLGFSMGCSPDGRKMLFANNCKVTFTLSEGAWQIAIKLPNGKAILIEEPL
jgi:hypothetical protein